jgi:hypothetical protein
MRIKGNFGASTLFDRRPTTATVGLSLAALSAFATLFQGITTLFSVSGFYFDFIYVTSPDIELSWRMGLIVTVWATLELIAIYLAMGPRPLARLVVIAMVGVKLLYLLSLKQSSFPWWQDVLLILFSSAPLVLLLSRASNNYYALK